MKVKLQIWLTSAVLVVALMGSGCGRSSLEGTYSNAKGRATLDLKSGGKAVFSRMGEVHECTYAAENSVLTLTCPDEDPLEFTIHEDGSLAAIGTLIGTMTKSVK